MCGTDDKNNNQNQTFAETVFGTIEGALFYLKPITIEEKLFWIWPKFSFSLNKMVIKVKLSGYDNFIDYIGKLDKRDKVVNVYFTGSKDERGVSWCPDCVVGKLSAVHWIDKQITVLNWLQLSRSWRRPSSLGPTIPTLLRSKWAIELCMPINISFLTWNQTLLLCDFLNCSWKDMKCPFRTDKNIHISVIPTFVRWQGPQRLEGEQLLKEDLLDMFLNDD